MPSRISVIVNGVTRLVQLAGMRSGCEAHLPFGSRTAPKKEEIVSRSGVLLRLAEGKAWYKKVAAP